MKATWKQHPATNDYDSNSNWTGGSAPSDDLTAKAIFGASSIHSLTFSGSTAVGSWTFTSQAPQYVFAFPAAEVLQFAAAGIVIDGKGATINDDGDILFENGSTAGRAHFQIQADGGVTFEDTSKAGTAHIQTSGDVGFSDSASAAKAHIQVDQNDLIFSDSSTAGNAQITAQTDGSVIFDGSSTAGHAHIQSSVFVFFTASSTAGSAQIQNDNLMQFVNGSSAGQAVITTDDGATTQFSDSSDGGQARFITKAGGLVEFANDDFHVGSIEGAGEYDIADYLVVEGNRSTKVSGLVAGPGTLVKDGSGTLTLSHTGNTFSDLELNSGTINVAAIGAGGEEIDFTSTHATLKIENAALSNHAFGTTVSAFEHGDRIDLAGLKFVAHAKATFDSGTDTLSVKSGKVTDTLVVDDASGTTFKAVNDGHGGTAVLVTTPDMEKGDGLLAENHQARGDDVQLDLPQQVAHHDFIL